MKYKQCLEDQIPNQLTRIRNTIIDDIQHSSAPETAALMKAFDVPGLPAYRIIRGGQVLH